MINVCISSLLLLCALGFKHTGLYLAEKKKKTIQSSGMIYFLAIVQSASA